MASQKRFDFGRAGALFNRKTIKRELTKRRFDPAAGQLKAAKNWAAQVRHPNFRKANETAVRGEFIQQVLVMVLGYTPYRAGVTFTVATEEALGKGAVDTALGTFSGSERTVLAPFELKGPGTEDLDAIMPGRNKSPVQQAWEYAIDAPGAKWVLVSNCAEIRLYAFGHGRALYETWDLGRLDDPEEHERLWLLLSAQNLLSGRTAALLDESANEQKNITNKLYLIYKETRDTLIQTLKDQPPHLTWLAAIVINKIFFLPHDWALLGYLNSRVCWCYLFGVASPLRGGQWRLELREQYMAEVPVPLGLNVISVTSQRCSKAWESKANVIGSILRRIPDLCPSRRAPKLTNRLREWWTLDFKSFRAEIKKAFKADIPLKQRDEWENFLREEGEKVRRLTAEIEQAEREINAIVYKLFDFTADEIALLKSSLAGQY